MKSKFDSIINKVLREGEEQNFSYYTGKEQDIIFVDDLERSIGKLRSAVLDGKAFKTVHLATKEKAMGYNYPKADGIKFYVFYSPEDFTRPALIPI